ncbi:MAG: hypothetical protein HKN60_10325 [Rhizobiales bacterium]|nr:hypothetical protein [Hyphomicrobiales bacterium]
MKSIITASAAIALFALAAGTASAATSQSAITGAATLAPVAGQPATPTMQLAHGFHLDCRAGPRRGWVHRNGFWSAGLPTVIGCRR